MNYTSFQNGQKDIFISASSSDDGSIDFLGGNVNSIKMLKNNIWAKENNEDFSITQS